MPTKGTIDTSLILLATLIVVRLPIHHVPIFRIRIAKKYCGHRNNKSLPFSDHCHEDTLDTFPESIPIIAANGSYRRLKSYYGKLRNIIELPSSDFHYPSAAVRITGSSFDIVTVQSKLGSLDLILWVNICHSFFCFY